MSETNAPAEKPVDDQPHGASCCSAGGDTSGDNRRSFLGALVAVGAGALALLVPAVSGLIAFLNPLRQKGGAAKMVPVASLETLPEDGAPQMFPVVTDKTDAWTKASNQIIGSVFLKRTDDEKQPVVAYQVVCPHAGCTIRFEDTGEGGRFVCPCHEAYFDLSGGRIGQSRSPRDMDTLDVKVEDGTVSVKFVNYRVGTSAKIPEA